MKKFKQTYHFLAVTVLIAVIANVLLPAGAAAARYLCTVQYAGYAAPSGDRAACCLQPDQRGTVQVRDGAADFTSQACSIKQIFEHAQATELSKTPVVLPNAQHTLAALPPLTMPQIPFMSYERDYFIDATTPFSAPPIFLMNSSFLN